MTRRRVALVAAGTLAALAFAVSVTSLLHPGVHSPVTDPDDFRAFYCAGAALLGGHDPYALEPLRTCEHAAAAAFGLAMPRGFATPAPLPPYAIAFFAPLAMLAFARASCAWFLLSLGAVVGTAVLLFRLTRLPALAVAGALVLSDAFVSLNEGQLVPIVACMLCVAAGAARAGRMNLAAAALAVAAMEPHLALPAMVALAVLAPSARRPLLVALFALAAIDLLAGGATRSFEYATTILPLHARSEVDQLGVQFSLTTLLWSLGVPTAWALRVGTLCYLATLAAGILLGRRIAGATGDRAALIVVPPAVTLLGGPFIHLFQMAAAIPASLLALAWMRPRTALAWLALAGLAIPAQALVDLTPMRAAFVAHLTRAANPDGMRAFERHPDLAQAAEVHRSGAGSFAPPGTAGLVAFIPKAPTWLALIALIVVLVRLGGPIPRGKPA